MKVAERFIEPTENGYHFYVLILNYIQTIYQKQEKYDQGIVYAQKILDFTQSFKTNDVKIQQFCQLWQGFTSIDMATILLRQKKMTEGEHFADAGYMQISQLANSEPTFESAKYEALKALTGTKLEMGRLDEVESFLKQMEAMGKKEGATPSSYFKHLSMYQFYAKLYELKGDYAKAVRYNNLVKPIEDSLRRRNDVRKLEKIQKRLDAEKYNTKLTLVENEKQDLRRLRNLSFGFLLLVLVLAYVIYRRIQTKRQTAITALAAAEQNLESVNNSVLETAQKVDMLNLEIEKLEYSDVRNGYLEQLLNSTILTEDDWAKFRHLFEKIYPDFIDQQKTLYPDLTPAETRLVVLDKLGINLQEMANMLGVSKNAIHQTRYRLRRKLGDVL